MLRLPAICLAFVLLGMAAPSIAPTNAGDAPETAVRDPDALPGRQPDSARPGAENQAAAAVDEARPAAERAIAEPEVTESAEIESLVPIETKSSIRVNANVSLPRTSEPLRAARPDQRGRQALSA